MIMISAHYVQFYQEDICEYLAQQINAKVKFISFSNFHLLKIYTYTYNIMV